MQPAAASLVSPETRRELLAPLRRLGRALKRRAVLQGCCKTAALLLGVVAVHFALDRLLLLGAGPRAALLVLVAGITAYQVWSSIVRSWILPIGHGDIAGLLERRFPNLNDRLASAVAFLDDAAPRPDRDSHAMIGVVVSEALGGMAALNTHDVFDHRRHRRLLAVGAIALAIAAGAAMAMPETMAVYLARNFALRDLPWPSRFRITLEGFRDARLRWPLGDDLLLTAVATEEIPQGLRAEFQSDDVVAGPRDMVQHGTNRFVLDYGPLHQSMRVRFLIGRWGVDEKTAWYDIEAVERPSIKQVQIDVIPPDYTRLPRFTLASGQTSADILRGSRAAIAATAGKPIVKATLRSADRTISEVAVESGRRLRAEFAPSRSGSYFFDLVDAEGLTDLNPVTYSFVLQTDPPPKVRFTLPGAGEMLVPDAVLSAHVECEDNLALKSVELLHRITPSSATSQPAMDRRPLAGLEPRQSRYSHDENLALTSFGVKPGDQLSLQLQARDDQPESVTPGMTSKSPSPTSRPTRAAVPPGLGESLPYNFRIVTQEELLAELSRREMEWRREFEQVIKSQEQIEKRLQDIRTDAAAARGSAELVARYSQEERAQRQQIGRMRTVVRQFEQILGELEVNQLAAAPVRRRLDGGVIRPMHQLIETDVPAAAERIQRLQAAYSDAAADQLRQNQRELVQAMYAVLANMLKWEGYEEAVAALRDIIRLQGGLNQQTQERLQKEIEHLFGEPPSSQPKD